MFNRWDGMGWGGVGWGGVRWIGVGWGGVVVVVVFVVLTLTRIIKSVVTGQAPVTLQLRSTPGENTHNPRWYTHISQLTQFMPPPETYKSEIVSQSTMCQVHAGAYVSLLTPGETNYSDCHPRKTTTYILHVVSITTHTYDRRKSIGEKKQGKEKKTKERKEKRRKRNETKNSCDPWIQPKKTRLISGQYLPEDHRVTLTSIIFF